MSARGFAFEDVVRGTSLDVDAMEDAHYLIDPGQYLRVVENMIALTGGGLGLDIGLQRDVKDFGILGYAALSCRSVRQSVEEFWGRYGDALGMMAKIALPRGDAEAVTLEIVAASLSPQVYRFFVEEALCLVLKVGAQVTGVETRFLRLQLSYAAPAYRQRYRQIFGCQVTFDAGHTRVTLERSWFERPLTTSDPELTSLYKRHLAQLQREIESGNPLSVRLHRLFLRHRGVLPPLDDAAHELGLSPRTFRRQLHLQGRSYRELVANFRKESSLELLRSTQLAAKSVGRQVGFEDVNAFRRAFKRWTGQSVNQYRATLARQDGRIARRGPPA
jgi:AraC-like DNA-binding protein